MIVKKIESPIIISLFIFLLGILLFFSVLSPVHMWGDGPTYYLQITSIAEDHDIQYLPIDIQRTLPDRYEKLSEGALILKRTSTGTYFYGKEFSYGLIAAPFFEISGIQGILVFNALMFWSMILMGFLYLRTKGNSDMVAFATSVIFFTLSTAVVYIFWIHTEIYNMFLLTLGLFLWIKYIDNPDSESCLFFSAIIFGLATVSRISNGVVFLPFIFYELYYRRRERIFYLLILFLLPILLFYGYFYTETGLTSFYGGNTNGYSFGQFPFINSSSGEIYNSIPMNGEPGQHPSLYEASVIKQGWDHVRSINYLNGLYNAFYYFFGRFTGLIWYYPLAAFALTSFLIVGITSTMRRGKIGNPVLREGEYPTQYLVFAGIILNVLFFILLNGNNYLGGQGAVGNRYFWIFPAFLFLLGRVNLKLIVPFIFIALFTVVPIISDPISNSQYPQNHTYRFPYPLFPVEYNQLQNLPLLFPRPLLQSASIYYIGSGIDGTTRYLGANTYSVSRNSQWAILKQKNIDHVSIIFSGIETGDSGLSVSCGNFRQNVIIKDMNPVTITIPLDQPDYYGGSQLYEISIRTTREIHMFPVSNASEKKAILYSDGWFDQEKDQTGSWRWMTSHSTLFVYSDTEQNKTIHFDASSYGRPYQLSLQVDENNSVFDVNPERYSSIISQIHLYTGYTAIQFNALEGCTRPSDNSGPYHNDTRCLSLIVRNMTIT